MGIRYIFNNRNQLIIRGRYNSIEEKLSILKFCISLHDNEIHSRYEEKDNQIFTIVTNPTSSSNLEIIKKILTSSNLIDSTDRG